MSLKAWRAKVVSNNRTFLDQLFTTQLGAQEAAEIVARETHSEFLAPFPEKVTWKQDDFFPDRQVPSNLRSWDQFGFGTVTVTEIEVLERLD